MTDIDPKILAEQAAKAASEKAQLAKEAASKAASEAKRAAKQAAKDAKLAVKEAKISAKAAERESAKGDVLATKQASQTAVNGTAKAVKATQSKGALIWRAFKWMFGLGLVAGLCAAIIVVALVVAWTRDLPTLEEVQNYAPAQMTRVHAGDGKLIAEYAKEHRILVPIETIPKNLQYAFVAAEDQRFYTHGGVDYKGLLRSQISNIGNVINGRRLEGGSTITQQVAKNFIVGNERAVRRKVREIFIARRIEKAIDKDHILELYLNEIFFARRSYGVAAASLNYFGKSMEALSLEEMAYLAILPKGPNNYQPHNNMDRALERRNYALGRMAVDGYVTQEQADEAKSKPLVVSERLNGDEYLAAEYFVEEARRKIFSIYGEDELYSGGLSIRTTLDTNMQLIARDAVRSGLNDFDKRHGYRGALTTVEDLSNWASALQEVTLPRDIAPWRSAIVLSADESSAKLGLTSLDPETDELTQEEGTLALADMSWAREDLDGPGVGAQVKTVTQVLSKGDVILVSTKNADKDTYKLEQVPNANAGILAMDPHTGRVLALVGGYSFAQSQFNRATQAYRQPGSAFKPFVYAAALDNGYTPVSQILDAPFVIEHNDRSACLSEEDLAAEERALANLDPTEVADFDLTPCFYKPENYSDKFYGLSTMRLGIEKSRNAMTVRLANDMGMRPVIEYGKRFGIYDEVKSELAWALGAGETTVWRLAAAYATLVNGGKAITPSIIDRVQDKTGKTIYRPDERVCPECQMERYDGSAPPELQDIRAQVVNPVTAYQMVSMLEGTVERGTGAGLKQLGRPLAGKTGTTNDEIDAWFMGFSPDLVVGVYVGYDSPAPMKETGAGAALPIFRSFMRDALKGTPKVPFRIPEGVLLAPVDATSGEPSFIGGPNTILEAFRPGTEPRLGELGSTIRIGGGSDSYIGDFGGSGFSFGTGFDDDAEGSDDDTSFEDLDALLSDDLSSQEAAQTDKGEAVEENEAEDKQADELAQGDKTPQDGPLTATSPAMGDRAQNRPPLNEEGTRPTDRPDMGAPNGMGPPPRDLQDRAAIRRPEQDVVKAPVSPEPIIIDEDDLDDGLY